MRFSVDTGACRSLFPWPLSSTQCSISQSADVSLVSANGSAMPTHGYENLTLSFGSNKYSWKFLVVDVTLLILSADFLSHFHLLVHVSHRRLVKLDSYLSSPLYPAPSNLALQVSIPTDAYAHILMSYLEVFRPELNKTPTVPAKHGFYPHINTTGRQVFDRFRSLAPDRLATTKQTFAKMEEIGLFQKASSTWSSPLHIVLMKGGLCVRVGITCA
ncbi:uncharacterized protein [Palaemon carinicauda]|uniref:uncharacterized protein n=1 Tax=Palaemon carinicauda TaxID=392227 RepID=UPI0035B5DA57